MGGLPGLNASQSQQTGSTATADGSADAGFNDSGFVVNFKSSGNAAASTGASAVPGWVYPALAVAAVVWLTGHR